MRVLIVEGESEIAEGLKEGLEEEKHRVSLAFNGRAGLELATSIEFEAIPLDLMLPVIDGFKVARRLQKCHNQTPILVFTARDAIADVTKALDLGADDFLAKPFSFGGVSGSITCDRSARLGSPASFHGGGRSCSVSRHATSALW